MKHGDDIEETKLAPAGGLKRFSLSKRLFSIAVPLAILALGAMVAIFLISTRPELAAKPVVERIWTVASVPATSATVQPERRFYGRIVAGREIDIRPEVSGSILEIGPNFIEGGVVRKGELLVRLDPFNSDAKLREIEADLNGNRAMLERDRERIDLLQRDVKRRSRLAGSGYSSEKALDDAKLSLSDAKQREIERRNSIIRLEVDRDRTKRDIEDSRIVAPFDGFLVGVTTAIGKFVNVGDVVAKMIRAESLEARFHVGNREFTRFLSDGNYQDVRVKVFWAGQNFDGTLDRIESEVQTASGGVEVFAKIDGIGVRTNLRPGAFVEVRVPGPRYIDVTRVPEEAVYGGDTVYRIRDDRLDPRSVRIVARDGKDLLIRGDYESSDAIVTTRFPEIGPGLKVRTP
jgi:RND family efflux transporter MFP subunit